MGWEGIGWFYLFQGTNKWRVPVETVKSPFRFHKMQEILRLAEELLVPEEGLCPVDLVDSLCCVRLFNKYRYITS